MVISLKKISNSNSKNKELEQKIELPKFYGEGKTLYIASINKYVKFDDTLIYYNSHPPTYYTIKYKDQCYSFTEDEIKNNLFDDIHFNEKTSD